jgi:hypothetical protein
MNKTLIALALASMMSFGTISQADTSNFCDNHPESERCQSDGDVGPAGPQGDPGVDGTNGSDGKQGVAGTDGINGTSGPAGPAGETGVTGPAGPAGEGSSVTRIAGTPGPAGTDGKNGSDGKQGVAGTDGAAGKTGATGPQGKTGVMSKEERAKLDVAFDLAYKNSNAINRWNDKLDNSIATTAAIGSLPQAYGVGKTQLSGGFSSYSGQDAWAVGISHRFNEDVVFKGGAAAPFAGGSAVFSVSAGWGF